MDKPIPEAVRDALSWLRAALDCPTFSWDADQRDAAEAALAAAQQQGQAVACVQLNPMRGKDDPHKIVYLDADLPVGTKLYAAPPSAPVGVDLDKVAAHLAEHGGDFDALIQLVRDAALAQQPAAEAHCATCSCVPGMTPAVRFNTTPAEREGAVRDHLVRMGWTPPAEAQAQGGMGCTHPEGFTHCNWCGAKGEQARGGGEVSRFTPSDADRHRCYNCGLRIADHVPDEDGARCKREAVRQLREITAPPSAPVGVIGAWEKGYKQGILDERISEANIGIAGYGAKVEPARNNPYLAHRPTPVAPVGVSVDVVREYLDARACYEEATRRPNSHAPAPVLKHGDPVILRLREARVALDNAITLAQQPKAVDGAMVERATMTLLGKTHDTAPGVDWRCDRSWTVNRVRELMRRALTAALAAQPGGGAS